MSPLYASFLRWRLRRRIRSRNELIHDLYGYIDQAAAERARLLDAVERTRASNSHDSLLLKALTNESETQH